MLQQWLQCDRRYTENRFPGVCLLPRHQLQSREELPLDLPRVGLHL